MGARILVVDDHALNLELVSDVLERAGHEVRRATSGEAAVALALDDPPDLILLDIGLPGMDGYATLAALRADERTRDVPVAALTAFAMASDAERARAAGFAAHITKPIDTRRLPEAVAELLGPAQEG